MDECIVIRLCRFSRGLTGTLSSCVRRIQPDCMYFLACLRLCADRQLFACVRSTHTSASTQPQLHRAPRGPQVTLSCPPASSAASSNPLALSLLLYPSCFILLHFDHSSSGPFGLSFLISVLHTERCICACCPKHHASQQPCRTVSATLTSCCNASFILS